MLEPSGVNSKLYKSPHKQPSKQTPWWQDKSLGSQAVTAKILSCVIFVSILHAELNCYSFEPDTNLLAFHANWFTRISALDLYAFNFELPVDILKNNIPPKPKEYFLIKAQVTQPEHFFFFFWLSKTRSVRRCNTFSSWPVGDRSKSSISSSFSKSAPTKEVVKKFYFSLYEEWCWRCLKRICKHH